jgi:hypothetical protein
MVIEMLLIGEGPYAPTAKIRVLNTNNAAGKQNDCSLVYKVTNYYSQFSKIFLSHVEREK